MALHHIKRPGIDLLTTFAANVFAIWKMMTMALHPKTSSPRTETTHHRYDRRTKESEMHPIKTLLDTPFAYCSMSLPFDRFVFRRQILISLKPS